jgi:hypothetical protein
LGRYNVGVIVAALFLAVAAFQEPVQMDWAKTDGWVKSDGVWTNSGPSPVPLATTQEFGDCEAHVEFKIPKGSNSGVYIQGRYEVQILDSSGIADKDMSVHDCGAIYERWKDDKGYEGTPPLVNAFAGPGEWNTYDIKFRAPRFADDGTRTEKAKFIEVTLNGKLIQKEVEVTGPTRGSFFEPEAPKGPIILQADHGPISYRNCWVKPL